MSVELKQFLYEVCIPCIVLLCVLAALFNIVVFISRFYVKSRSASLELTYSLALSDTWTSLVIAVSLFWNSYKPVILGIHHNSMCFPLTLEAFRTGGLLTGIFHLTALAFVHQLMIARPFDYEQLLSLRAIHLVIGLIWVLPPFTLFIYFSSWPQQGYRNSSCMGIAFYENLYFRANVSLVIIVLIITTCYLYGSMLYKINAVRSKTSPGNARGQRTVITATLIFGTFLFGWMPASIMYILTAENMPLHHKGGMIIHVLSIVVMINIMIKSLTNPIIYATRIPEIRQFVQQKILWRIIKSPKRALNRKTEMTPLKTADSH